jgi:hypothetical protein
VQYSAVAEVVDLVERVDPAEKGDLIGRVEVLIQK